MIIKYLGYGKIPFEVVNILDGLKQVFQIMLWWGDPTGELIGVVGRGNPGSFLTLAARCNRSIVRSRRKRSMVSSRCLIRDSLPGLTLGELFDTELSNDGAFILRGREASWYLLQVLQPLGQKCCLTVWLSDRPSGAQQCQDPGKQRINVQTRHEFNLALDSVQTRWTATPSIVSISSDTQLSFDIDVVTDALLDRSLCY